MKLIQAKEIEVAVVSMMHNLENESSIMFGDHVRKGIYLSMIHNKDLLTKENIQIKLNEYSYTSETSSILAIAKKIQESNAIAVHGYDYSSHALLSQHSHKNKDLSVVLPTATSDEIAIKADNYFQIAGNNFSQAHAMVNVLEKRNIKSATLIKRPSCAYCVDLANQIEMVMKQKNINLEIINKDTPDKLKIKNDYVFLPMYETEAIKFIQKLSIKNKSMVYIGGDGWTSRGERYFNLLDHLNFEAICLAHWNKNKNINKSNTFTNDYKSFFGSDPSDVSALSYDSMNYILQGITQINKYTRKALKNYLLSQKTFSGITGSYNLKENLKEGYLYLKWNKDKFKVLDEI